MSSTLSTLEVLQKARELISDPKRWTQGEYAKDEHGMKVCPNSSLAVCFCSIGAVARAMRVSPLNVIRTDAYEVLSKAITAGGTPYSGVYGFNDTHDHADVLRAFDAAISKATAEGETA